MKRVSLYLILFVFATIADGQNRIIELWPNGVPNNLKTEIPEGNREKEGVLTHVFDVTIPTLTIYPANVEPGQKSPAVIICPGGGYVNLSILKEGYNVAEFFAANGITGIVLKYRLPRDEMQPNKTVAPIQDAQQAIRLVRSMANELNLLPDKIGIMGFSAGGHLAATASTRKNYWLVEGENLRPDFSLLIYPVASMKPGVTHMGSHDHLLGEKPSLSLENDYSTELQIDQNTPPTFIVHAFDDRSVPIDNSLRYMERLREFGIECEMHLYKKGGHGFGMLPGYTDTWPALMVKWINDLEPSSLKR